MVELVDLVEHELWVTLSDPLFRQCAALLEADLQTGVENPAYLQRRSNDVVMGCVSYLVGTGTFTAEEILGVLMNGTFPSNPELGKFLHLPVPPAPEFAGVFNGARTLCNRPSSITAKEAEDVRNLVSKWQYTGKDRTTRVEGMFMAVTMIAAATQDLVPISTDFWTTVWGALEATAHFEGGVFRALGVTPSCQTFGWEYTEVSTKVARRFQALGHTKQRQLLELFGRGTHTYDTASRCFEEALAAIESV